ncbi:MAG: hypothetical protein EB038_05635, partial [Cyclobacteriaceae bacterium]|nr:hypothetical protein [Cyclobacteriaceae bacterium]
MERFTSKKNLLRFLILVPFLFGGFISNETMMPAFRMKKIVLDAGHGGSDPGNIGSRAREKDINLAVTLLVGKYIKENMPDALVGLAASAALAVSDIPFNGPISEVRVGKINGTLVINPTRQQLENSTIDMIVAATATDIAMVEGEMSEISEDEMLEAIQFAHEAIKQQIKAISTFAEKAGLKTKRVY